MADVSFPKNKRCTENAIIDFTICNIWWSKTTKKKLCRNRLLVCSSRAHLLQHVSIFVMLLSILCFISETAKCLLMFKICKKKRKSRDPFERFAFFRPYELWRGFTSHPAFWVFKSIDFLWWCFIIYNIVHEITDMRFFSSIWIIAIYSLVQCMFSSLFKKRLTHVLNSQKLTVLKHPFSVFSELKLSLLAASAVQTSMWRCLFEQPNEGRFQSSNWGRKRKKIKWIGFYFQLRTYLHY